MRYSCISNQNCFYCYFILLSTIISVYVFVAPNNTCLTKGLFPRYIYWRLAESVKFALILPCTRRDVSLLSQVHLKTSRFLLHVMTWQEYIHSVTWCHTVSLRYHVTCRERCHKCLSGCHNASSISVTCCHVVLLRWYLLRDISRALSQIFWWMDRKSGRYAI